MSRFGQMSPRRLAAVWREVSAFLGASTARLTAIALSSLAKGIAEAAVLVLIARVALVLADGGHQVPLSLGPLGALTPSLNEALALAAALAVAMLGLNLVTASLSAQMAADALGTARARLSTAFLEASWSVQASEREGHLQEVLTTHAGRLQAATQQIISVVTTLFNLAALVVAAFVVDVVAALALVAAVTLLATLLGPLNRLVRRRAHSNLEDNTWFATQTNEMVSLAQETTVLGVTSAVTDRMVDTATRASRSTRDLLFAKSMVPGIYQSTAILVVLGGLAVLEGGGGSIAALSAIVLLMVRSIAYGQQLQVNVNNLNETAPYLRSIRTWERTYRESVPATGTRTIKRIDRLELQDVSYEYANGSPALAGVSLRIERGETIGVVGPSGSGKSTLIQVLLRLRIPTSGTYRVNDTPVGELSLESWYAVVGVVPQQARLFDGSIAENIRFFRPRIDDRMVDDAARRANIDAEIADLPAGKDTRLRGSAGGVSGGQAQRLCIARALAGDPQFLVLDEPTSSLDVHSEELIQQTLTELKDEVTMVIIAHRLSTLRRCDRIVVLEQGRLRGFDTPEALEAQNTYYRQAVELSRRG